MSSGVVLDTSFLITLADPVRDHHQAAKSYWKHFLEQGIPVFLPTIVVSEFYRKQEIPPDILNACETLPFNWNDARKAAEMDITLSDRQGESRAALKDDVKIISQGIVKDAQWLITDDSSSFYRYASNLQQAGKSQCKPIKLEDGFDPSFFDPNGQRSLDFDSSAIDAEQPDDQT